MRIALAVLVAIWALPATGKADLALDPRLEEAAEALARACARAGDLSPLRHGRAVRLEVTRAGAAVAEPQVAAVIASDPEMGRLRLLERIASYEQLRPSHAGFGVAPLPAGGFVVVALFGRVSVEWEGELPAEVPPDTLIRLRGRLLGELHHPQLHVVPPGGLPVRLPLRRDGEWFEAELYLVSRGRTVLEVMGVGPHGPEVALLSEIYVGEPLPETQKLARDAEAEGPRDVAEMRADLDRLRAQRGLPPLRYDPLLQQVAQAYAEELLARGRFGHVSPESGKVSDRLRRAGYDFRIAGENLGEGPSPAVAHRAIVQSPAHLSAILEPRFESIGIGVARSDALDRTVVVHVLATP
ncbi:MAG: CAP domain-containing protein [Pseudomonadota bacterium]|nr:MAG: hypothetical protein DIU72_05525 [Pseudomonadota bacterium]